MTRSRQTEAPGVALVTGAAHRIGRAIAEDLAVHGWAVAIHYNRSAEPAEAFARGIQAKGGRAMTVAADLVEFADMKQLIAEVEAGLGPVTLLVNNASLFEGDEIGRLDAGLWQKHMGVNLAAPCFLADAMAMRLPEGVEGNVVNLIDQRVWKPTPQFFSYTLSKAALWMATRTMAQALAPRVRVNAIGPGPTLANERQSAEDFAKQTAAVPLKRGPGLHEFGRTVRYIVETPSMTGQMIALDGGQHLAWETPDVVGIAE